MAQAAIAAPSNVYALPYAHPQNQRSRHVPKYRFFIVELSQALFDFVIQLLPTAEEMAVKEDVRKLLERLIRTIEPGSRLLSFGSTANGFSLRNSGQPNSRSLHHCRALISCTDMDLCCLIDSDERLSAADLVTMLGDLLERGPSVSLTTTRSACSSMTARNQISRQALAPCAYSNRQALLGPFTWAAFRHCV